MLDLESDQILDGYFGRRAIVRQDTAAWTLSLSHTTTKRSPWAASIEAPFPYWVEQSKTFYHHANNFTLCPVAINMMKSTTIPGALPWIKKAAEIAISERGGASKNYPFWEKFFTAMDHATHISKAIPYKRQTGLRILNGYSIPESTFQDACLSQWRSCRFQDTNMHDRLTRVKSGGKSPYLTKAALSHLPKAAGVQRQKWEMWSRIVQDKITAEGRRMEADPKFNPNNVVPPRGEDGAMRLWHPRKCFRTILIRFFSSTTALLTTFGRKIVIGHTILSREPSDNTSRRYETMVYVWWRPRPPDRMLLF